MTSRLIIFVAIMLGLSACEKIDVGRIENLNGGTISVIGHGGSGFQSAFNELPENSMASIKRAVEIYNADGVELDIQLTKDHQLVPYHDNKLETSTDGYGYVYEFNLSELKEVKYNNEFYASLFLNETITSLEDVLIYFSNRRIKPQLHLDLRTWLFNPDIFTQSEFIDVYAEKLVELIERYNYSPYTFIGSSSKESLLAISKINPNLKLCFETESIRSNNDFLQDNSIYGIIAYNDRISNSEIEFAHRNNIRVILFNVKSQKSIVEAVNKNPDYIITDNIPKLQQVLF
tara:strand:+ start:1353 stop:2219 length:867 start_codon:yes stop_codon:yes gene_type:complete